MDENTLNEVYQIKENSLRLISEAHTEDAIILLKKFLQEKDSELLSQLLLISNQFYAAKKEKLLGLGNKDKILNRINYSLIDFINNLEYELAKETGFEESNTVEKKKFLFLKGFTILVIIAILYILVIRENSTSKRIQHDLSDNEPIKTKNVRDEHIYSEAAAVNSPMKKNKITLKYKSEKSKEIHQKEFYLNETLVKVKEYFLRKYKIENTMKPTTNDENKWAEWIIMRGETTKYSAEDELLSLETLVSQNKLSEYDELMIAKSIIEFTKNEINQLNVIKLRISDGFRTDEYLVSLHFPDYGHSSSSIAFAHRTDIVVLHVSGDGINSGNYQSSNFALVGFENPNANINKYSFQPSYKYGKPINREEPKRKNSNYCLLNRYGLKTDDEIYILSDDDE